MVKWHHTPVSMLLESKLRIFSQLSKVVLISGQLPRARRARQGLHGRGRARQWGASRRARVDSASLDGRAGRPEPCGLLSRRHEEGTRVPLDLRSQAAMRVC